MNKKNITPNPKQPVDRVPAGQLPSALAELTEAALSGTYIRTQGVYCGDAACSFEGEDE